MTKTTAARVASGRKWSSAVAATSTTMAITAITSWASWVRPPAESTTAVLVGLPLTQKAPVTPAARLAMASPTRSRFSFSSSSRFWAKLRAVAALWARTTTKIEAATAARPGTSPHDTWGSPMGGSPAGTDPTMATPWRSRRRVAARMIDAATTRRVAGIRLDTRSTRRMTATARTASAAAGITMWPREPSTVPIWLTTLPLAWTPSMPGSWVSATWTPTPLRNPTSAVRERKSARKPRRNTRAISR